MSAENCMEDTELDSLQLDLFSQEKPNQPTTIKTDGSFESIRKAFDQLLSLTDDFCLLERIPLTKKDIKLPYQLSQTTDDAQMMVFLDTETTGLNHSKDKIIELGLVLARFSPKHKRLISIEKVLSVYEDPGFSIAPEITSLTGITNEMVKDQHFDEDEIEKFISPADCIVAHNAGFDRTFFENRFAKLNGIKWGCSLNGVDWTSLGFNSRRQEELLMHSGYFYEAHRASIDCLALSWLMHINEKAFALLLESIEQRTVIVHAFGSPFAAKDALKTRGYHWQDGTGEMSKHWWIQVDQGDLQQEKDFLDQLYHEGSLLASYTEQTAQNRFRTL